MKVRKAGFVGTITTPGGKKIVPGYDSAVIVTMEGVPGFKWYDTLTAALIAWS